MLTLLNTVRGKYALIIIVCLYAKGVFATEIFTVAVASSLYTTLQQRTLEFNKKHHAQIKIVFGSTGRLYNQIQHGAPFDVFIAADKEHPELLIKQHKASMKRVIGYGYLGLFIDHQQSQDIQRLVQTNIRRIVIANPNVAPFGRQSKKLLLKKTLWEALKPKLIYAQNAMQARMMVDQGLVDAGFVPVRKNSPYFARIPYVAVLLSDHLLGKRYLQFLNKHD
ncbi:MAG: molybdate ABC transporter substrate-binding protein [Mariprofundaceae bacterium]|nr:molybdate ABC transporter substrate-binding protein [Mariprofundaceae bacterium]